jgi:hypothetical protein
MRPYWGPDQQLLNSWKATQNGLTGKSLSFFVWTPMLTSVCLCLSQEEVERSEEGEVGGTYHP